MIRFSLAILLVTCVGCGDSYRNSASDASDLDQPAIGEEATLARSANNTAGNEQIDTGVQRKIIYVANLSLVVDDFGKTEQAIPELVELHGGYLSNANVSRNRGSERSGNWTARIPVDAFDQFLDATVELGIPERREQTGQDVTEEFVDLEARIASKKKLEERILELLDDNKGEIKDVIEVERELERVRTEIEQMEGRLRYLKNRTALTTVTIHAREEKDYTPPQAPGFGGRIANAWTNSTGAMGSTAEGLLLFIVACLPWLLLVGVIVGPLWYWRRREV
ncbi:MAG: DUF4349 domain-containing protein [Aeoliella sp.]